MSNQPTDMFETESPVLEDPSFQARGQIMLIQRYLRNGITERREKIEEIEAPQYALGFDSLHVGPLGFAEQRGPCVYFVGLNPCKDDLAGQCSACGYNRITFPTKGIDEEAFIRGQFYRYQQLMDGWSLGLKDTRGIFIPQFSDTDNKAVLVTGFIGSWFSNFEVSPEIRTQLLGWIAKDFQARDLDPQVHIEARAEDVVAAANSGELDKILPHLKEMHARIILGLESSNDYTRNVIYAKTLRLEKFREAVQALQSRELGVNAFVFMGNHSMSEIETLTDVLSTLDFLKDLDVTPVIMTPSLTPGSFNDLLAFIGKNQPPDTQCPAIGNYQFAEPRTLLAILRHVMRTNPYSPDLNHYPFMVSLGGGPPEPSEWMFNAPGLATCDSCAETIKKATRQLIADYNYGLFEEKMIPVDTCSCQSKYKDKVANQSLWPDISNRVTANINLAKLHANAYLEAIKD